MNKKAKLSLIFLAVIVLIMATLLNYIFNFEFLLPSNNFLIMFIILGIIFSLIIQYENKIEEVLSNIYRKYF